MLGFVSPGLRTWPISLGLTRFDQIRSQGQFIFQNWKNRPQLLMGAAAQSQCKGMHAGRAGEGRPPPTAAPLARTATSRVKALP